MNSFQFRPAKREAVGLLIALAGGSGSGKTFSSLRLATGMSGGKPFAVIDTEAGRAKHYADMFHFDHGDLKPPFRPDAYAEAIKAADAAGYPVIVVDSASHEHAGEGGLLDWHEEELNRMAGDDWKKRESLTMLAWVRPKTSHKAMVQKLLQVRAHIILCFRAEERIEIAKQDGKTVVRPKQSLVGKDGWLPVCEKTLPFEATCSFLLLASEPGMPHPIKLQAQHRDCFPENSPISEVAGEMLAKWAAGAPKTAAAQDALDSEPHSMSEPDTRGASHPAPAAASERISESQYLDLLTTLADVNGGELRLREAMKRSLGRKIASLRELRQEEYTRAIDWSRKAQEAALAARK